MEYESLHENLIAIYQNKSQDIDAFADQLLSRAARIGVLQAALLEDDLANIKPSIVAFLSHTVEEITIGSTANAQALESRLPVIQATQKSSQRTEITSLDVDAFFEEYPECMKVLPEGESDDESDSGDSDVVEVPPPRRPKKDSKLADPQHGTTLHSAQHAPLQNSNADAPQNKPMSNPYQKRPQPTNHYANVASRPNPYSNNAAQSNGFVYTDDSADRNNAVTNNQARQNQQQYQQQYDQQQQQYPHGSTAAHAAWENYQQQPNPFQTAREFAHSDQKNNQAPHASNDGWNHRYNDPNHHYVNQNFNGYPHVQQEEEEPIRGGPSIPDSLKRKFQPPKRVANDKSKSGGKSSAGTCPMPKRNGGGVQMARPSSSSSRNDGKDDDDEELPEELQHLDKELVKKIQNEIMESGDKITFEDIAGLEQAKQTVQEVVCWPMKRPDLFTGLRRAPNGLLLYGPPGTGKTLIGKAIAHESGATFFSISSSSLTSKWIGEGEKLVRTLFAVAAFREPAVVFIDEIDSLLTQRKASENEASRRIKTEFLVQLDGTGTSGQGRVLVIGATNRPQELDEAARRRFTKRLYIPLPEEHDRFVLLQVMLKKNKHNLLMEEIQTLAKDTEGFSGADLKTLCTDAAMGPIRKLKEKALSVAVDDVPPITYKHFRKSLRGMNPSNAQSEITQYVEWDQVYGTKRVSEEDSSSDEE